MDTTYPTPTKSETVYAQCKTYQWPISKDHAYIYVADQWYKINSDVEGGTYYTLTEYGPPENVYFQIKQYLAPSTQLDTEEGFTKGDWSVNPIIQKDPNMCPISYYEINNTSDILWVAHVGAGSLKNEGEALANAHLIASAKDMYLDIIKPLLELLNNCSSSITIKKNSLFEKDLNRIAKKANPNYKP